MVEFDFSDLENTWNKIEENYKKKYGGKHMVYEFRPDKESGVCSKRFKIEIEGDKVLGIEALGGCNGNLKGINALVKGMTVDEVIERLSGITCGFKSSSCPNEIANALKKWKTEND